MHQRQMSTENVEQCLGMINFKELLRYPTKFSYRYLEVSLRRICAVNTNLIIKYINVIIKARKLEIFKKGK